MRTLREMPARATTILAVLVVARSGIAAGLPDPAPVFDTSRSGRGEPGFSVAMIDVVSTPDGAREMLAQPSLGVGNKAVVVRWRDGQNRPLDDGAVSIVVDRKALARIVFWGDDGKGNFGYPFKGLEDEKASLLHEESSRTIRYRKPYLTPSGRRAVFSYTLESMGESQVRLVWDLGVRQEQLAEEPAAFGFGVWISMPEYRSSLIEVGSQPVKAADRARLLQAKTVDRQAVGDLDYAPDLPTSGFSIRGDALMGGVRETLDARPGLPDSYLLEYRLQPPPRTATGHLVIDLGQVKLRADQETPPVGGIDFWAADATHVPRSPVRNVMPNPSFEQGLRYWTWMDGGATYTPAETPRYSVVEHGRFGPNALLIRNVQASSSGMMSFPVPLDDGEDYTLSFYARCETAGKLVVSLASAAKGGRHRSPNGPWGDVENPEATFTITKQWQRYSRSFTADAAGIRIGIMATATTLIDGMQLEKGRAPTDFVPPPIDGHLMTADADNILEVDQPIDAKLRCIGVPGTQGFVVVSARNSYGEPVYRGRGPVRIGPSGQFVAPLPFTSANLGEGVFVVRTEYAVPGSPPYVDYHRLAILKPLSNQHPTKNLCGTIGAYDRISRGEDLARWLMQWGFGSTSWGYNAEAPGERPRLEAQYRITNIANVLEIKDPVSKGFREWTSVSPALERQIEDAAYLHARRHDPRRDTVWTFGNEEEGSYLVRNGLFADHLRVQMATARGVTRAIPGAIMLPTCGTSGYSRLRGYDAMEGYLSAAQAAAWRYGGIAVHPYGSIDGGLLSMHDLDEETARLLDQMKRFGYGPETPVFYTEMFNIPETYLPEWNADRSYDEYSAGKATYDFGNREFIQAASAARAIIIMLKYWPQVHSANLWMARPFMDMRLTPLVLCKAINTIGHTLGDVRHLADIKPSSRIRGYVFQRGDGTGVAAVWCIDRDVENGLRRGPTMTVPFGQKVWFQDLMGCFRDAGQPRQGRTTIPLTPAPLFIHADDAATLASDLERLEHDDASSPLELTVLPTATKTLICVLKNRTGREQVGRIVVGDLTEPYRLSAGAQQAIEIEPGEVGPEAGRVFRWEQRVTIEPDHGPSSDVPLGIDYFFLPRSAGAVDWARVPALPLKGWFGQTEERSIQASTQLAWNADGLQVRVTVDDEAFSSRKEPAGGGTDAWPAAAHGVVSLYLDTAANGRMKRAAGLDQDDYRYDLFPSPTGQTAPGRVRRVVGVYHQLADGTNMPTAKQASEGVPCFFERTADGYRMTITLGERFILPITLRAGATFGLGILVHDRGPSKAGVREGAGVTLALDGRQSAPWEPSTWPVVVLLP